MAASFFDVLRRRAREVPDVVAAIDGIPGAADCGSASAGPPARCLTYAELCHSAERLAGALAQDLAAAGAWTAAGGVQAQLADGAVLATSMRRGTSWYSVFWAAVRLQVPVVALSCDLPDAATERQRNREILAEHRPALVVADEAGQEPLARAAAEVSLALAVKRFAELWHRACAITPAPAPHLVSSADATLCFNYTGGTTKASRCARISHRMALHECEVYQQVVRLRPEDRVLQQHSLYWGASAYGEVDIALAFGCALVFAEAWDTEALVAEIRRHGATCAGLVPSVLAAIEHRDVPTLRCVFTWGEALQARVAREWARHVRLIDLLISTECWLSLYADWSAARGDEVPEFVTVSGTQVRLRPVHDETPGAAAAAGQVESGELLVAGPMVSRGYTDDALNATAFDLDSSGRRWYCTKDCLKRAPGGGYRFAGRADDLVKVGGVWVDTRDVESKLRGVPGVSEACVCRRDAFVALRTVHGGAIAQVRGSLPTDFALYIVPFLPKSPGTGKVDRRRLWDIVACRPDSEIDVRESQLCAEELTSIVSCCRPFWLLAAGAVFWSRDALEWPWLQDDDPMAVLAAVVMALLSFACACALSIAWRFLVFSFVTLASFHLPEKWQGFCGGIPCREMGVALGLAAFAPGPVAGLILAGPGLCCALQRGRVLSWPMVCGLGAPIWLRDAGWWALHTDRQVVVRWYFDWWRSKLLGSRTWTWRDIGWWLARHCRLTRYCTWCKNHRLRYDGRREAEPDGDSKERKWYCNKCWRHYYSLNKCASCEKWTSTGVLTPVEPVPPALAAAGPAAAPAERWLCWFCLNKVAAPPALDASAPLASTGRPAPAAPAQPWGGGSGGGGLAPFPKIERRVISTPPLPPRNGAVLAAEGPKRSADAITNDSKAQPEQPPSKRRHLSAAGTAAEAGADAPMLPAEIPEPSAGDDGAAAAGADASAESIGSSSPEAKRARKVAKDASTAPPSPRQPPPPDGLARSKSREWKIIEQATGMSFDSTSDSLLGLDSLRHTKMTSALRRELGKRMPRQVLKNSGTLGVLLKELARIPEEEPANHAENGMAAGIRPRGRRDEYAAWGMMWGSRCQWVLHVARPLPESIFREAMGQLLDRHAALRAQLRDPYRLFAMVQQALSMLVLWRRIGEDSGGRLPTPCRRLLERCAGWALRSAWPRVGGLPPGDGPFGLAAGREAQGIMVKVLDRTPTMQDAEWAVWGAAKTFTPPFRAILAPYGADRDEGALLHITVTHMLSDGYCVVPLLDDLASLVASAEATAAAAASPPSPSSASSSSRAAAQAQLPGVPDAFAALETRIHRTIDGTDDAGGLHPRITPHAVAGKTWRNAHTTFATLPAETVAAIRASAACLAVPDDIAMLTLLGVTLAWFSKKRTQRVAMIVPQRDGPGENDMVGLFSDVRHFTICTDGLSVAGVALRLHHIVKERLWTVPHLRTQFELPLLNFEWTDFQEKQGFAQHVQCGERAESSFHPLRVAVDQPHRDTWRLRVAFQEGAYDAQEREAFFELFERGLCMLRHDPLGMVWDTDSPGGGGEGAGIALPA